MTDLDTLRADYAADGPCGCQESNFAITLAERFAERLFDARKEMSIEAYRELARQTAPEAIALLMIQARRREAARV